MTTQTEAERLADELEMWTPAELRRLVSFNQQLMDEVARLQKREWVGLTSEEIKHEWEIWRCSVPRYAGFAKGIEAKLKEKNT
jgi:hypothetical protein